MRLTRLYGGIMNGQSARVRSGQTIPALCLGAVGLLSSGDLLARDVQVGRYASLVAALTGAQTNLLSTMVTVKFPSRVKSVGAAIRHLLRGSGYQLAAVSAADPGRFDLLSFPLPAAHRSLGPMPLHEALETLGGPAFRLVEDPLHRLVSFERCGPRMSLSANHPTSHRR
jgi:conjugative transfer region protein (TIGR03748 family)